MGMNGARLASGVEFGDGTGSTWAIVAISCLGSECEGAI